MTDLRTNSEIADGVHWIKDRYVNAYLVELSNDLVLVDSGANKNAKRIMKYVKSELEDQKISSIYLTHHHSDHIGGLHFLHGHFHTRNFVHSIDAEVVRGERHAPSPNNRLLKPLYRILYPLMKTRPVTSVELVDEGDNVNGFEVYHLPGHTMGSLGFLRNSVMFSGDAAVSTKDGGVTHGIKFIAENKDLMYHSIGKLSKMEFDLMLPGHGTPILGDASQRVKDAAERFGLLE